MNVDVTNNSPGGPFLDVSSPGFWSTVPGDLSTTGDCYSLDLEGVNGTRELLEAIEVCHYTCGKDVSDFFRLFFSET